MNRSALVILTLSFGAVLYGQTTNPLIAEGRAPYNSVKNNLLKMAEKVPADDYSFKPSPDVQSFAERINHIANQIGTCSSLTGERKPAAPGKTKDEIVAALKASFDACDAAWDSMNDKTAMEMVAGRGGQRSKLGVLIANTNHDSEMYGYLSVYLRLKGIVPPSSEGGMRGGR